jgi:hypothetical protein
VLKDETYEGKSRGSESRFEPALLEPLPPGVLYAFFAGDDDEGNCAGLDEPAIRRASRQVSGTKQPSGTRSKDPKMYHLRANKGDRPVLLGVLFIPTARRATAPRSGVPACVEGVPPRKSGSAGGGA